MRSPTCLFSEPTPLSKCTRRFGTDDLGEQGKLFAEVARFAGAGHLLTEHLSPIHAQNLERACRMVESASMRGKVVRVGNHPFGDFIGAQRTGVGDRPLSIRPQRPLNERDGREGAASIVFEAAWYLDLGAFGQSQSVFDVYAEVAHRAFDLGVSEQDLHRTKVAGLLVDNRCLRAPK